MLGIVIVDLEDSDEEDSYEAPSIHVNSVLIEQLRSRAPNLQNPQDSSKALVLFRPVQPVDTRSSEKSEGSFGGVPTNREEEGSFVDEMSLDDDAMDIEQI